MKERERKDKMKEKKKKKMRDDSYSSSDDGDPSAYCAYRHIRYSYILNLFNVHAFLIDCSYLHDF